MNNMEQARELVYSLKSDEGQAIMTEINLETGYVNATKLCQSADKLWGHYYYNQRTKDFLTVLSGDVGISISELVISKKGGTKQGTWVHPQVAIDLASWCSTKFQLAVTKLVMRYLTGELTTQESYNASILANETNTLITHYHKKQAFYIGFVITPEFSGGKIGRTDDYRKREEAHIHDFGNFKLIKIWETLNHKVVEQKILDECKFRGVRRSVEINGKMQTELVEFSSTFTLQHLLTLSQEIIDSNVHPVIEEKDRKIKEIEEENMIDVLKEKARLVQEESRLYEMKLELAKLTNGQASTSKTPQESVQDEINEVIEGDFHPIRAFIERYCDLGEDKATDRYRVRCHEMYETYVVKHPIITKRYPLATEDEFDAFLMKHYKLEQRTCNWTYTTHRSWLNIRMKEKKTTRIQQLISEFIELHCILGVNAQEDTKKLYDAFEEYANDKGFQVIKQNGFSRQNFRKELLSNNENISVKKWAIDGKKHAFSGIQLNTTVSTATVIKRFVDDKCTKAIGYRTFSTDIWDAFVAFRNEINDNLYITKTMFYNTFKEQNPDLTFKSVTKSRKGFIGIALNNR